MFSSLSHISDPLLDFVVTKFSNTPLEGFTQSPDSMNTGKVKQSVMLLLLYCGIPFFV